MSKKNIPNEPKTFTINCLLDKGENNNGHVNGKHMDLIVPALGICITNASK